MHIAPVTMGIYILSLPHLLHFNSWGGFRKKDGSSFEVKVDSKAAHQKTQNAGRAR